MVGDDVLRGLGQVYELLGELWSPDDIRLVDVDVLVAGREPEPVLAELLAARRRHRHQIDLMARLLLEPGDLLAQKAQILTGRIGRHRQFGGGSNIDCTDDSGTGNQRPDKRLHVHWSLQNSPPVSHAPRKNRKRFGCAEAVRTQMDCQDTVASEVIGIAISNFSIYIPVVILKAVALDRQPVSLGKATWKKSSTGI